MTELVSSFSSSAAIRATAIGCMMYGSPLLRVCLECFSWAKAKASLMRFRSYSETLGAITSNTLSEDWRMIML